MPSARRRRPRRVLAEIRRLTPQPIRYDRHLGIGRFGSSGTAPGLHCAGTQMYKRLRMRDADAGRPGRRSSSTGPGTESQLPVTLKQLEQRVANAEAATPPPPGLQARTVRRRRHRCFLTQNSVRHTLPTATFTTSMTLHLGGHDIQVRHYDHAMTLGRHLSLCAEGGCLPMTDDRVGERDLALRWSVELTTVRVS